MTALKLTTFKEVEQYATAAAKDHIAIQDATGAIWFRYIGADGKDLGVCALLPLRNGKTRLKACWILKDHQDKGHYESMIDALIVAARALGAGSLEVIEFDQAFFTSRGFKIAGKVRPNGAVTMLKEPV